MRIHTSEERFARRRGEFLKDKSGKIVGHVTLKPQTPEEKAEHDKRAREVHSFFEQSRGVPTEGQDEEKFPPLFEEP